MIDLSPGQRLLPPPALSTSAPSPAAGRGHVDRTVGVVRPVRNQARLRLLRESGRHLLVGGRRSVLLAFGDNLPVLIRAPDPVYVIVEGDVARGPYDDLVQVTRDDRHLGEIADWRELDGEPLLRGHDSKALRHRDDRPAVNGRGRPTEVGARLRPLESDKPDDQCRIGRMGLDEGLGARGPHITVGIDAVSDPVTVYAIAATAGRDGINANGVGSGRVCADSGTALVRNPKDADESLAPDASALIAGGTSRSEAIDPEDGCGIEVRSVGLTFHAIPGVCVSVNAGLCRVRRRCLAVDGRATGDGLQYAARARAGRGSVIEAHRVVRVRVEREVLRLVGGRRPIEAVDVQDQVHRAG